MNTMKINIIILLLFAFYSCNNLENKKIDFNEKIKNNWKLDSLGCQGKRNYIIAESIEKIKLFKGQKYQYFYENFGKSNEVKTNKYRNIIYLYWIGCGLVPEPKIKLMNSKKNNINLESKRLLIEVKKDGTIVSLMLIVP